MKSNKPSARRLLSTLTALALSLSLMPTLPAAAAEMRELYVSDSGTDNSGFGTSHSPYKTLEYALAQAQTGDRIHIIGTVVTKQPENDIPLIINKGVTIEGDGSGILKISHAGIILGNNVTFSSLALGFSNPVRNAIIANGYSLTMKNVTRPANTRFSTHLFAGGLSDTKLEGLPSVGDDGEILLFGKVEVGEIHAGGLSDVSVNDLRTEAGENTFEGQVYIEFSSDLSQDSTIGAIYGCGAREVRGNTSGEANGDTLVTDPSRYKATGGVQFILGTANKQIDIDGSTGDILNAEVVYNSNDSSSRGAKDIKDISRLEIQSGKFSFNTTSEESFLFTDIVVHSGQTLELHNFKSQFSDNTANSLTVKSFTSMGTKENPAKLTLKAGNNTPHQQLNILGQASGVTMVALGGFKGDTNESWNNAIEGNSYIIADGFSFDANFLLAPSSSQSNMRFTPEEVQPGKVGWKAVLWHDGEKINLDDAKVKILNPQPLVCIPNGEVKPEIEVWLKDASGQTLVDPENYTIDYAYNDLPGEAYVHAEGIESKGYVGTATRIFEIVPCPVTDTAYTKKEVEVPNTGKNITIDLPDPAALHKNLKYGTPSTMDDKIGLKDLKLENNQLTFTADPSTAGNVTTIKIPVKSDQHQDFCPYEFYDFIVTVTSVNPNRSEVTILGVEAASALTYNGFPQKGYTGTVSNNDSYKGGYKVTYSGRKDTTYGSDTAPTNAGDYTVIISVEDTANYTGSTSMDFSIGKKDVIVRAEDKTAYVGDPAPKLSYTAEGFALSTHVPGEEPSLGYETQPDMSKPGTATIKFTKELGAIRDNKNGENITDNYNIIHKNGTLTVVSRPGDGGDSGNSGSSSGGGGSSSGGGGGNSGGGNSGGGNSGGGGGNSGGGGGGGSVGTKPTTEKKPDNSTAVTDKADGTVTETIKNTDGSTTTIAKTANGTIGTVVTDQSGAITQITATVSSAAVAETAKNGEAVKLPVEVPASVGTKDAPAVVITIPESTASVKVEIPVETITPGTVAVIVNADGTEKIVKTSIPGKDGVILKVQDNVTVKIVDNSKTFTDTQNHWANSAIDFVTARELFSGTGATTFSPNADMTRGQLMTVLARFAGHDTAGGSVWYEKGMEWAKANGISDGTNPNGSITREQLVSMLWRYAGSPSSSHSLNHFSDADQISDYAQTAFAWANEQGIINGTDNGVLNPQGNATRAQVAQMLAIFLRES